MIRFPDTKLWGLYWKPYLGVPVCDGTTYLRLQMMSSSDYAAYNDDCFLLLKFGEGYVQKLPFYPKAGVVKDSDYVDIPNDQKAKRYITISFYSIPTDAYKALFGGSDPITKICVKRVNGEQDDYEIKPKYQKKLMAGLRNSLKHAKLQDSLRVRGMSSNCDF